MRGVVRARAWLEGARLTPRAAADVLCVGADGMSAFRAGKHVMGSVSDGVVKKCRANVLVAQTFTPSSGDHDTLARAALMSVLETEPVVVSGELRLGGAASGGK